MKTIWGKSTPIFIKFFLYFAIYFFAMDVSSTVSWAHHIILPFILWGNNIKKISKGLSPVAKDMLVYYLLFATLILITALPSEYGLFLPFTRFSSVIAIAIVVALSLPDLNSKENVIAMLDGIILAVFIVVIHLFTHNFNGFVFVLTDEGDWGTKNTAGNTLYFGFVMTVLRSKISGKNIIFYTLSSFLLICIVMTTSMKCIITGAGIYLVYCWEIRKSIPKVAWGFVIVGLIIIIPKAISIIMQIMDTSPDIQKIFDRLAIFFGHSELATTDYGFMDTREEFMARTIKLFYEHPIFGIGLENSRIIYGTYSHNTYVEILAGGGIVLIIPFILFLLRLLRYLWKKWRDGILLLAIFGAIIFISNTNRIYDHVLSIPMLFYLAQCRDIFLGDRT